MKVVLISHTYVADVNRKRLREMAKLGIDLTLVVPDIWKRPMGSVAFKPASWEQGYRIKVKHIIYSGRQSRFFFMDHSCGLFRENPDIVHIEQEPFCLMAGQALMASRFFAPQAKTLFMTWQNIFVPYYGFPFQKIENYVHRHAGGIVCGNRKAEEILRRKEYQGSTWVLPDKGIDLELYKKDEIGSKTLREELGISGFVVGYLGRLVEAKGIFTTVEAVAAMPEDVQLLIVGGGKDKDRLKQAVKNAGIEKRTIFQEVVPHTEVPRWLNIMDVMVLPSLTTPEWKEQFGHTIIEAMACGVPVVGSSSGEIPNVIGNAGIVFQEGDSGKLRKALETLYSSPAFRSDLAQQGLERAKEFSHLNIAKKTIEIYRELLNGTRW